MRSLSNKHVFALSEGLVMKRIIFLLLLLLVLYSCSNEKPTENLPENISVPNSPNPPDYATNIPLDLSLTWACSNTNSFDLYFDTLAPPQKLLAAKIISKSLEVRGLSYLKNYYWKVVANLSNGDTVHGSIWKFTTIAKASQPLYYKLNKYLIEIKEPSYVNIMYQVTDKVNLGVTNLTRDNFQVLEDGAAVSPTESEITINKKDVIPYKLKTVLMLDNSASVGANLQDIKNAALALISKIFPQQEIAVYKFSQTAVLLQDFTTDVGLLTTAINSLDLGYQTTDLYGAVIAGVSRWDDLYELTGVRQGFLVLLTDGSDTQGSHSLNQALNDRGDKKVYAIGLGNEIVPTKLQQIGNAGFYSITDYSLLTSKFTEIQNEMNLFANSFYWLYYKSPKRGNFNHTLELTVKNNTNNNYDKVITGSFNSSNFFSSMVKLIRPIGGEKFIAGTTEPITWESFAVSNIKIEYTSNNGSTWVFISNTADLNKQYNWSVPNITSDQCRVVLTNIDDPTAVSVSANNFTINIPPAIPVLLSPANNETNVSITPTLSWNASSTATSYRLQVSSSSTFSNYIYDDSTLTGTNKQISGLNNLTKYYWRVSAKNNYGTSSSSSGWNFTTIGTAPSTPELSLPSNGSTNIAIVPTLSWNASSNATSYRLQVSTSNAFLTYVYNDSGLTHTSQQISGLNNSTKYYWRVSATNNYGTKGWSETWSFTTSAISFSCGRDTVVYADKTYNTVQVGTQCWLKENLDIGTMIQSGVNQSNNETIEKYCYDNNSANCTTYGGLYQWNEAMQYVTTEKAQGICPTGWHIPTKAELETLSASVGNDGNKLKREDQGTGGGVGINTSGFSALLAGFRFSNGTLSNLGLNAAFWSSTERDATHAYYVCLWSNVSSINMLNDYKEIGFSIRCLKD